MAEKKFLQHAEIRMGEGGLLKDRYPDLSDSILPCLTTEIPREIFRPRSKPFFENGTISILFVGNLIPLKGIDNLLEAVSEISKTRDTSLTIVGRGRLENKLRKRANLLGLGGIVRFTGQIPFEQLLEEYRRADVFILPSHSEGFPRVVLEAFSQSLPVITTPVGAQKTSLTDMHHCMFTTPGNSDELAANILKLVGDKELAIGLGENGFNFAKTLFQNHPVNEFEIELKRLLG